MSQPTVCGKCGVSVGSLTSSDHQCSRDWIELLEIELAAHVFTVAWDGGDEGKIYQAKRALAELLKKRNDRIAKDRRGTT